MSTLASLNTIADESCNLYSKALLAGKPHFDGIILNRNVEENTNFNEEMSGEFDADSFLGIDQNEDVLTNVPIEDRPECSLYDDEGFITNDWESDTALEDCNYISSESSYDERTDGVDEFLQRAESTPTPHAVNVRCVSYDFSQGIACDDSSLDDVSISLSFDGTNPRIDFQSEEPMYHQESIDSKHLPELIYSCRKRLRESMIQTELSRSKLYLYKKMRRTAMSRTHLYCWEESERHVRNVERELQFMNKSEQFTIDRRLHHYGLNKLICDYDVDESCI
jgi:hypothetical protein